MEKGIKGAGLRIEVRQESNKDAQLISLEKALKIFKKKIEKEGILRIIKDRRYYIKPSQLEHDRIRKIQRLNKLKRKTNKNEYFL